MHLKFKPVAVAILALVVLMFLVAGCGGSTTTTAGDTTTTAADTTTTAGDTATTEAAKVYRIGIAQIVTHPALDAAVTGFIEALAAAGYVEGKNITFDRQNAQGEPAVAATIAQKFAGDKVDLIYSVATPTSQAAAKATTTIPIVFAAVTDPVAAGLVKDAGAPEGNVTGCSDLLPVQPHLELIKELVPDVKTIGLLYNAGETNSVTLVNQEKAAAEAMGLKVVEASAASSAEVLAAAQSLVGRCEAISVLTDNTVVSAIESVVKVCQENKIALVAGDIGTVEAGAVAAYAFDYHDHGVQAGNIAAQILQGTPIAKIPVQYAQNLQLAINLAAAAAMGVTIPDALKAKANTTF
ncbi:MAG: ABC transporter substrate binding protein [Actinobacteria bacterium ADurb.Bin444]|nr:MAG: ABC transporter substrate binding protein [Actinobacteria bacterium ADurb.Bin444]